MEKHISSKSTENYSIYRKQRDYLKNSKAYEAENIVRILMKMRAEGRGNQKYFKQLSKG